jgi:hypothetical protein
MLTLKSAWADGTRQLLFEPLELLEKLAALIPRPRIAAISPTTARCRRAESFGHSLPACRWFSPVDPRRAAVHGPSV